MAGFDDVDRAATGGRTPGPIDEKRNVRYMISVLLVVDLDPTHGTNRRNLQPPEPLAECRPLCPASHDDAYAFPITRPNAKAVPLPLPRTGGSNTTMSRSVSVRRWPALTLALLAIWGLLLGGQPVSPFPGEALPEIALLAICHSGPDHPRHPDHPVADCGACLLCQAAHGDHAAMLLVPRGAELPVVRIAIETGASVPGPTGGRRSGAQVPWARGPPTSPDPIAPFAFPSFGR